MDGAIKEQPMTDERKAIECAQEHIGALKKAMRDVQKANEAAGNLRAANAAMGLRGDLVSWHAKATEALYELFPEFASEIQARGPGGR